MNPFIPIPRRSSRRWAAFALAAVLTGGVTACAEEEEVPAVEEVAVVPAEVPVPAPVPSVSAPPEEGEVFPPPDLGPGEVGILLAEWDLETSADTVPPGPTTFVIHNAGNVHHAFEIEGQGIEKVTEHLHSPARPSRSPRTLNPAATRSTAP
jgi:hypothetical protein